MIQIPTSYTISVLSAGLLIWSFGTQNHQSTFNFAIILCIAGCAALANLLTPKTKTANETEKCLPHET